MVWINRALGLLAFWASLYVAAGFYSACNKQDVWGAVTGGGLSLQLMLVAIYIRIAGVDDAAEKDRTKGGKDATWP